MSVFFAFTAAIALFLFIKAELSPDIPFLPGNPNAEWVRYPQPPGAMIKPNYLNSVFSKEFGFTPSGSRVLLEIRAFKHWRLFINGEEILANGDSANWKKIKTIDITHYLKAGHNNDIAVMVSNSFGPPLLWLYVHGILPEIKTDGTWISASGSSPYLPASLADDTRMYSASFQADTPWESVLKKYPELILFFILSISIFFMGSLLKEKHEWVNSLFSPRSVLALAILFLGAMFFNNLFKTSPFDGFDPKAHINYVDYILQFHSLPLATDGWEAYQPPLFYSIVALFFKAINHLLLNKSKAFLLSFKLVTFSCAIGQVYLAYVAAKILFPGDNSKQVLATAVASVLPVNIYIAHYISNESLSAFLISASIVYTLRLVTQKENRQISSFWFLGVLLGLSLLTKITILCFLPVLLFVILYDALKKRSGLAETGKIFAEIFLPAIFISGWFYIRNWMHFGKLIVTNMSRSLGFLWWQDPGYHTYRYFTRFGMVFVRPYYASFHSFFDGIYSTLWGDGFYGGALFYRAAPPFRPPAPWNYEYMNILFILALPASAAILIGLGRLLYGAVKELNKGSLLLVGSFLYMGFSMIYLSLKLPFYSIVKAHYGLGLMIPISIACALGIDFLDEQFKKGKLVIARAFLFGWFGALMITVFFTFTIR